MTAVVEAEVTAVHGPGTDLAAYTAHAPEEYRARFVMEPSEAAALDKQLRDCMRAVLVESVDYGFIPGVNSKTPSLFKPGAEKLIQWFGFGFENVRDEIERDGDGVRVGVTYRCTVYKQLADGRKVTVATCEGYAGFDEDKFFTSAEAAEQKERANAARYERSPNKSKFAEYRAPWNSVLKMAQKRALVGAAIDATAAAGLFTQDLEDMRAPAAPDTGGLAEAAMAAVMALADDVREGLDKWYRGKRWPDPAQWTAEQWCAALQMAGYLTARREQPEPSRDRPAAATTTAGAAPQPEPAVETAPPMPDAGDVDPEVEFVRRFVARVADADESAVRSMRVELGKAVSAKVISPETANELGRSLTDRMTQVRSAA